jgi:putative endonuclease
MHSHSYFVYLLRCADGTYYTGVTNDVERRLEEHQSGCDPKAYTFNSKGDR